jgi:MFS transporter, DHA1 family, multidrug resistance protein
VVRDVYTRDQAARVLAYMSAAMALAPMAAPVLGGVLVIHFGWRSCFLVLAAFGALAIALTAGLLPETNRHKDPEALAPSRLLANTLEIFRHREFWAYALTYAFGYAGIFAFISGSPFVFIGVLGLSPDRFGLVFAGAVVGYIAGTLAAGRLWPRLGIERLVRIGSLIAAGAGLAMALIACLGRPGLAGILAPMIGFMFGAGLVMPNAVAGAVMPFPARAGAASSLLGFVQMTLAALVGAAVGHLVDDTARPMAGAVAFAGVMIAVSFRWFKRR